MAEEAPYSNATSTKSELAVWSRDPDSVEALQMAAQLVNFVNSLIVVSVMFALSAFTYRLMRGIAKHDTMCNI